MSVNCYSARENRLFPPDLIIALLHSRWDRFCIRSILHCDFRFLLRFLTGYMGYQVRAMHGNNKVSGHVGSPVDPPT